MGQDQHVDGQAKLRETLELQRAGFKGVGGAACPFYVRLCDLILADVDRGGPVWQVLEPYALEAFDKAYVLRLLGAMHRMALNGDSPELAAHFPSTGGDGDEAATYDVLSRAARRSPAADPRHVHAAAADQRGRALDRADDGPARHRRPAEDADRTA